MSRRLEATPPILVAALTLVLLPACGGDADAPVGTYAAACDLPATITFKPDGVAEINRNFCEGYAVERWSYAVDGDTLQLAPEGKLGDSSKVQIELLISSPDELTPTDSVDFLTCNNCDTQVWKKQ